MEDKRSREILEFKKFLRESREKPDLDRYAQELFGERMEALGFTTFKNHRWYKLVRDELLLSFGLLPTKMFMGPVGIATYRHTAVVCWDKGTVCGEVCR